jgi:DNA repair protein RadC
MQDLDVEEAWVVLLSHNYKLIKAERISRGGITETAVDVRLIVKSAVLNNATIVALVHNHPSNNTRPSKDDDRLTERVKKACEVMRLYMLDHVIVTDGAYYSYREQGKL